MIPNIISCCRKCLNPNETLYVEIRNVCKFYLYARIEYRIGDTMFNKQSPVFGPGKSQRVTFPSHSLTVYLKIFNCEQVPPGVVCSHYIRDYMSSCYRVTGRSIGDIQCTEVPC